MKAFSLGISVVAFGTALAGLALFIRQGYNAQLYFALAMFIVSGFNIAISATDKK